MDNIQQFICEVKELANLVNFNCEFENGACKSKKNLIPLGSGSRSCCYDCEINKGYGALNKTNKHLFKEDWGFCASIKGCRLPVRNRPLECLCYTCDTVSSIPDLIRQLLFERDGKVRLLHGKIIWPKELKDKTRSRIQYLRKKAKSQEVLGGSRWRLI